MKPYNGFIISIFTIFLSVPFSLQAQSKNCNKLDVTVKVEQALPGEEKSVVVSFSDPAVDKNGDLMFFLLGVGKKAGKNDRMRIREKNIKDVPPGKYDLVIVDLKNQYCSETRTLTVN